MARNNRNTKPPMPPGPEADGHNLDESVVPRKPGFVYEPVEAEPVEPGEPEEPTTEEEPAAAEEEPGEKTEPEPDEPTGEDTGEGGEGSSEPKED